MNENILENRWKTYNKEVCWQKHIREINFEEDVLNSSLSPDEIKNLVVSDFVFNISDSKKECKEFIERHEWLGTLTMYSTHYFEARYNGILAGVIIMSIPNAFSKVLGYDCSKKERLISRGACISWSPKNLASSFLMWCIGWMVQNTEYRVFRAYSDPEANELGTIYQACNFYYIGKGGRSISCISPHTGKKVSDRYFRQKTCYKRIAKNNNIEWEEDWNHKTGMNWENVPDNIEKFLKLESKKLYNESEKIVSLQKHRYIYVLGKNKRETKILKKQFLENNKVYEYPKERGK